MVNASVITPFWNRIPRFFLYGFHPHVLILAGVIMVGSFLLDSILFNLVCYAVMIKYGAEALLHTMDGELDPPKLSLGVINNNYSLPFKLLLVILCYYFFIGYLIASTESVVLVILITIVSEMLIPAIVTSLIVTDEIGYALNPINWFNIPFRIGWGYLVMVVFLFLFNTIEYFFTDVLVNNLASDLVNPLWMAMNTYFTVVMFHLMGYVVLQYHEELGHDAPAALQDDDGNGVSHGLTTPLLERFMEEGNVAAAIAELASLIEDNPQDLELRRRMYNYLRANGEEERLKQYAPYYFGLLAEQRRFSDAAGVFIDSLQRGEPFHPQNPGHYLPVMKELRLRRANKEAVMLAQGFHKRFPDNPFTPPLYLEMSQVLSEELQRDDLAQQALNFVLKKFPGHEIVPQAQQYLDVLIRLQAQTSPGT